MNRTFRSAFLMLAGAAGLHVVATACSQGGSFALAGPGGTGGNSGTTTGAGAGSCTCPPAQFQTFVEPCPPGSTNFIAQHAFPGVPAASLARVVAMANTNPPVYGSFPGNTVITLVQDGVVGAYCSEGGQVSVTFVAPMF